MLPLARPLKNSVEFELLPFHINREKFPIFTVVFRGYYPDTMGRKASTTGKRCQCATG